MVLSRKPHTCECRTAGPETAIYLCIAFFCGGDIKLSVVVVLRTDVSQVRKVSSHLRKVSSHLRSDTSQKVFLCRCKPTTKDFGKRFCGGKGYEKYRLDKNLESTNPKSNIIFRQLLKIALQVIYGIFLGRFLLSFD